MEEELKKAWDKLLKRALTWFAYRTGLPVPPEEKERIEALAKRAVFDPSLYRDKDGKLLVLQVFDKEDTEKDHWPLSRQWFEKKYGKAREEEGGKKLVFESESTRIILYMGDDEEDNKAFLARFFTEHTVPSSRSAATPSAWKKTFRSMCSATAKATTSSFQEAAEARAAPPSIRRKTL